MPGGLVLAVESLAAREVLPGQLAVRRGPESLFCVKWAPVQLGGGGIVDVDADGVWTDVGSLSAALEQGGELPGVVVVDVAGEEALSGGLPAQARGVVGGVLGVLQRWLGDERAVGARLVVLTHGAVRYSGGDGVDDLAGAGVWGLVRSAQSEYPGRGRSSTSTGGSPRWRRCPVRWGVRMSRSLPCAKGRCWLHGWCGRRWRPRRGRAGAGVAVFDPGGSVLVTGGTGRVGWPGRAASGG